MPYLFILSMMRVITFERFPPEKRLFISTDPYFIEKARGAGEEDLKTLVDKEMTEGCWIFTPHNNHWYNILSQNISGVNKDGDYYVGACIYSMDVSQFGDVASNYHIHPKSVEEQGFALYMSVLDKKDGKLDDTLCKYLEGFFRRYLALQISMPSSEDMGSYAHIIKESSDCQLDFRISSQYGIITVNFEEYAVTDAAEDKYSQIYLKSLLDAAQEEQSAIESITSTVKSINQQMGGLLVMEMDFRGELQRGSTRIKDRISRWFRKARLSNSQYEITIDSQGKLIINIKNLPDSSAE